MTASFPAPSLAAQIARPRSEWHEDMGPVLWWKFPIDEAPYAGTPNDLGQPVEVHTHAGTLARFYVGGWPGYHTHWTPLVFPEAPDAAIATLERLQMEGDRG